MKHIAVVYHDRCPDGLASAMLVKGYLEDLMSVKIKFFPIGYQDSLQTLQSVKAYLNDVKDEHKPLSPGLEPHYLDVIFLDYTPSREAVIATLSKKFILIIDHHDEARIKFKKEGHGQGLLSEYVAFAFENNAGKKCSATAMTASWLKLINKDTISYVERSLWIVNKNLTHLETDLYLYLEQNNVLESLSHGEFYTAINDYDTWELEVADSPNIYNGFRIIAARYKWDLDTIMRNIPADVRQFIDMCKSLWLGSVMIMGECIAGAKHYPSQENPVVTFVNAPKSLASEIARHLHDTTTTTVVVVYQENLAKGIQELSIRTAHGTPIKALEIAKLFGGGGHEHAAGAILAYEGRFDMSQVLGDVGIHVMEYIVETLNPRK